MQKLSAKDFFIFSMKFTPAVIQAHSVGLDTNQNNIDAHWNLIKGNYNGIIFPVIFKQEYGKNLTDILGTGWPGLYLVSDKIKDILDRNHFTGWKVFPIKLYDKKGIAINGYHGFSIAGRCGPTSYKECEIIEKRIVPNGPICRFYKGVSIRDWDGSDFFTPAKTYEIFISKRAADTLKAANISNLRLENLAESETDVEDIL